MSGSNAKACGWDVLYLAISILVSPEFAHASHDPDLSGTADSFCIFSGGILLIRFRRKHLQESDLN